MSHLDGKSLEPLFTRIVSAVCKAAGIRPVYRFYPWKRAEAMIVSGQVFAAFPYAVTDERKNVGDFSEVILYGENYFFFYDKNPNTPNTITHAKIDNLQSYKIGSILGSFVEDELKHSGFVVESTAQIDNSIKKLKAGRIDFFVSEEISTYHAIRNIFPAEIEHFKMLPEGFGSKKPNVLLVSRAYPNSNDILKKFNQGLAQIKRSGEFDEILRRHLLTR
ncbi:substrate-binding periplasmic protein [Shewanella xiamenensis]|uniref:substrate-binding periplasmic protein n=1 Tax=Shewanella xiamenensis TaxID=332186 RepID=UPI002E7BD88F|nr:transporter substrate-binding domain-containing protein [Shewanella xiamenensis]MEE1978940.1 transporter substrate-binding domain-containing protein [Shewanella xiamenensis]